MEKTAALAVVALVIILMVICAIYSVRLLFLDYRQRKALFGEIRKRGRVVKLNEPEADRPSEVVDRPPCPFFGFFLGPGVLLDQRGNQCALLTDHYSPCTMSIRGETPNWIRCDHDGRPETDLDKARLIRKLKQNDFKVCAREFWPKGQQSWEGLPFEQWFEHVCSGGKG